jgi:hypothetical protein
MLEGLANIFDDCHRSKRIEKVTARTPMVARTS